MWIVRAWERGNDRADGDYWAVVCAAFFFDSNRKIAELKKFHLRLMMMMMMMNWTCCAKQFWDCIALKIHRYATIASASHAKSMFYNNKIIDNYYSDIFIITLVINGTQFLICDYCLVNWIIYNNFYLSVVFFFVHSYAHMQMALQQLISPIMNGVWVCSQSDDDKMLAWMCITNAEKEMKISPLFASRR